MISMEVYGNTADTIVELWATYGTLPTRFLGPSSHIYWRSIPRPTETVSSHGLLLSMSKVTCD